MDKILGTLFQYLFKYADKKVIPLLVFWGVMAYYVPIAGQTHINYALEILGGASVFTLLYMWLVGKTPNSKSTQITVDFIQSTLVRAKSNAKDLRLDDPDKEVAVRIFLITMIDEIKKTVDALITDRDYSILMQRTLEVKETLRKRCEEHNVPLDIYYHIHELNEKRVMQFYNLLQHVIVSKDSYSESEKLHLTLLSLYHFLASLIDSTIEAGDDLNGSFTKSYEKYKQQGKYLKPIE